MYYAKTLTVPPRTEESNPVIRRVKVYPGITQRVWIGFPPGCCGLAHMVIYHGGVQVWPTTADEDYSWDAYMYTFEDHYPILAEPLEFTLKAWNEDDSYEHMLYFAVVIEYSEVEMIVPSVAEVLEELTEGGEG